MHCKEIGTGIGGGDFVDDVGVVGIGARKKK